MIVTIDGPAGAGKSTTARALAQRLGFDFLDTGAMYRAVTLAALQRQVSVHDEDAVARLVETLRLELPPGRVLLDGEDVTSAIRSPEVTSASGAVASNPAVRRRLVDWQRALAAGRNIVCEGRDQGTIVFPNAERKFFLVADALERARRRRRDLLARGDQVSVEEVLSAQEERDRRDAGRAIAPMVPAPDAIHIDTTQLTLHQVIDRLEAEVRRFEDS